MRCGAAAASLGTSTGVGLITPPNSDLPALATASRLGGFICASSACAEGLECSLPPSTTRGAGGSPTSVVVSGTVRSLAGLASDPAWLSFTAAAEGAGAACAAELSVFAAAELSVSPLGETAASGAEMFGAWAAGCGCVAGACSWLTGGFAVLRPRYQL